MSSLLEQAERFRRQHDAGMTIREIAEASECHHSAVQKRLAIFSLPPEVQPLVGDKLGIGMVLPLLRVKADKRAIVAHRAVVEGWTVSRLRLYVRRVRKGIRSEDDEPETKAQVLQLAVSNIEVQLWQIQEQLKEMGGFSPVIEIIERAQQELIRRQVFLRRVARSQK